MNHVDAIVAYLTGPNSSSAIDIDTAISNLEALAVVLRSDAERDPLGRSDLPSHLARLLQTSKDEALVLQAGRVAANLVVDHDDNRTRLVEAGYVAAAVDTLSRSAGWDLTAVRAVSASLLNLVVDGHEPTRAALVEVGALDKVVHVTNRLRSASSAGLEGEAVTSWTIVKWLWTVMEAAVDERPTELDRLAALVEPLGLDVLPGAAGGEDMDELAELDVAALSSCARVLERVCLNALTPSAVPGARPHPIDTMLSFVEGRSVCETRARENEDEDGVKAAEAARVAVRHAVVELLSEHRVDRLEARILGWIGSASDYATAATAMLIFGNWVRDDASAQQALPALLPRLQPWLDPATPVLAQHALVGLLRNLAIPPPNKAVLGRAGVIEALAAMEVWGERTDITGSVQGGAVGVVKNLCFSSPDNAMRFIGSASAVAQIRALIKRTDDPAIRFEATRVLVNAARSAAASPTAAAAWATLTQDWVLDALCGLIRAGKEHVVLVGEGVAALALLATFGKAKQRVADELVLLHADGPAVDVLVPLLQDGSSQQIRANIETLVGALKGTEAESAFARARGG
ncbi:hypothetical protein Q5752_004780 [Cryptotrichosporon argae]